MFKKRGILLGIVVGFFVNLFILPSAFAHDKRVITIDDNGFNPANLVIPKGTTVEFRNIGENNHWPASNIHPTHDIYPEFDPKKTIASGESWEFTFHEVGYWRFHDHIYPTMIGSIRVTGDKRQNPPKKLEEITFTFPEKIKYSLLNIYFLFYPQDKTLYVSRQDIGRIILNKEIAKLSYLISLVGSEKIVKQLFDQSGQGAYYNCHVVAHSIGRTAYIMYGEKAIQKNITLCHSGYQHGVMAAFVYATGADNLMQRLEKICASSKSSFAQLTCYHGVGHGIMGYFDNDVPTAVNQCLTLENRFRQNNCMVGVFMENIGAKQGDSLNEHPTKWIKEGDMHFPCNALDQNLQVQSMCYSIQPDWMSRYYKHDFTKVIQECMNAPEIARPSCFFGTGQEIALFAALDPKKIVKECSKAPEENNYQERCYAGSQAIILDYWGPNISDQGDIYCATVPEKYQSGCETVLENRKKDLKKS